MINFFLTNSRKCKLLGLVLGLAFCNSPAYSEVCFLPSGGCESERAVSNTYNPTGTENCSNYNGYIKTSSEITNAKECHPCGGYIYCLCPDGAELSGSECVCKDSNKVLQGGSCRACPSGKHRYNATTCKCDDEYNYIPIANEVCDLSCDDSEYYNRAATQAAANHSSQIYSNSSQAALASQAVSQQVAPSYLAASQQAAAYYSTEVNARFLADYSENAGIASSSAYYKESSCHCRDGYEYFGSGNNKQCLEKCKENKGQERKTDGTCDCADSKKEWNATQGNCVCKAEYDTDGNGNCITKTCDGSKTYNNSTKKCECPASARYESLDACQRALGQQAYNLNWWDMLQQKTASALSEFTECLLPRAAYAQTVQYATGGNAFVNDNASQQQAVEGNVTPELAGDDYVIVSGQICPAGCTSCLNSLRGCGNLDCSGCAQEYTGSDIIAPSGDRPVKEEADVGWGTADPQPDTQPDTQPATQYECVSDDGGYCWYQRSKDWLIVDDTGISYDCIKDVTFEVDGKPCPSNTQCKLYIGSTLKVNYTLVEMQNGDTCTFNGFYFAANKGERPFSGDTFTLTSEDVTSDYRYWNVDSAETVIGSYEDYQEAEIDYDEIEVLIEDAEPDDDNHKKVYRYVSGPNGLDKLRESDWYVDLRVYLKDRLNDHYGSSCDGNILADYPMCYDGDIDQGSPIPYVYKKKLEIGKIGGSGATYTVTDSGCQEIQTGDREGFKVCLDNY